MGISPHRCEETFVDAMDAGPNDLRAVAEVACIEAGDLSGNQLGLADGQRRFIAKQPVMIFEQRLRRLWEETEQVEELRILRKRRKNPVRHCSTQGARMFRRLGPVRGSKRKGGARPFGHPFSGAA